MTARCESCREWVPNLAGPICRACLLVVHEATKSRRALPEGLHGFHRMETR